MAGGPVSLDPDRADVQWGWAWDGLRRDREKADTLSTLSWTEEEEGPECPDPDVRVRVTRDLEGLDLVWREEASEYTEPEGLDRTLRDPEDRDWEGALK